MFPAPVRRWLDAAWTDGRDRPGTLVLAGRARMWRPRLPIMRLDARISARLGRDRVSEFAVRCGPLTLLRGLDATVDGRSVSRVGRQVAVGPEVDQGSLLSLWGEAAVYPSSWPHLPGLRWEPLDGSSAWLRLPLPTGEETAVVTFDPETGYPARFEVDRFKGAGGPRTPWSGCYRDWRTVDGVPVAHRLVVQWGDEARPWFDLTVTDVQVDAPAQAALARGRALLATTGAKG